MPGVRARAAIVAACALAAAAAGAADPLRRTGSLYVWTPAVAMTDGGTDDGAAQQRLLDRCAADGIGRIHFLVDPDRTDAAALRRFLVAARGRGVDVWALTPGRLQREWVATLRTSGRTDADPVLDWIARTLALEGSGAAFAGIQVDVEPHRARPPGARRPAWRNARAPFSRRRNVVLAEGYLDLLDAIAGRAGGRAVAATIPWWWDREDLRPGRGGERRTLFDEVRARVDLVTVMAYRAVDGRAAVARLADDVADEIARGPTEVLLETAARSRDGAGPAETMHRGGMRRFREVRARIEERFAGAAGFRGVGAHAYLDAYASGTRRWR